jgi:hypothetical protein
VWEGLRRAGRHGIAADLARRAWEMFEAEWSARRHSHENFHRSDPAAHEAHDSDPFYSWGALIPFMWEAERADACPWDGLCLGDASGGEGSLALGGRRYRVASRGPRMSVLVDEREVVAVSPPARLSRVAVTASGIEFQLDAERALALPGTPAEVTVDGRARPVGAARTGGVELPAVRGRVRVRYEREPTAASRRSN